MGYILGIILGLLISLILILLEVLLYKSGNTLSNGVKKLELALDPKGSVIEPKTDLEEAQEEVMTSNEDKGRDTDIDDIL